jgi:CBS domain-containing protein
MTTTARNVMQSPALTVGPDTPLGEVQHIFVEQRIHGLPVVDVEGAPLGMVSSTDLLSSGLYPDDRERFRPAAVDYLTELLEFAPDEARDLTRAFDDYFGSRTVADVMTRDLVTIDVDAPIQEAAATLTKHQIHRVVVTEHGRVCGVISSLDLVALLARGV